MTGQRIAKTACAAMWCAVVSTYQMRSKVVMNAKKLIDVIHFAEEVLWNKLLEILEVAMIEMCQNTQSITVCCLWGCKLFNTKSTYKANMSIRTGIWSNSKRYPGLMNHSILSCEEKTAAGRTRRRRQVWFSESWVWHSCGCCFDTYLNTGTDHIQPIKNVPWWPL